MSYKSIVEALKKATHGNSCKMEEAIYIIDSCSEGELEYIAAAPDIEELNLRLGDYGFNDTLTRDLFADALNF